MFSQTGFSIFHPKIYVFEGEHCSQLIIGSSNLKRANEVILKEGYGLSTEEILLANSIWRKLSNRRLNRKKSYLTVRILSKKAIKLLC